MSKQVAGEAVFLIRPAGNEGIGTCVKGVGRRNSLLRPSRALSWLLRLNPQDCHRCWWRATTNNLSALRGRGFKL